MIRIYTISRVLSMGDTMGCGVVSIRINRHFSRHGKLGPQEGRELGLVYTIRKAPADNGTLRRGTTSDERKGRPCWRFHCPAWWSNSQENMQINYLQRLTRKLRLGVHPNCFSPPSVQFKGEINDALPRKRHQKRHLEFCTAYLLRRMPQVRVLPGAPSH